jgi:Na+/proline symporter
MGKVFSWAIMAIMAYLAIHLPQTIWRLMEIKLEILCQVAPAIFLGIHINSLRRKAVLYGLLMGTITTLTIMFGHFFGLDLPDKPWGFHAGVWGLAVNFVVIGIVSVKKKD